MMIIRRIVTGTLAAAVIGGGGVAMAPSAFAQPRQCGLLALYADGAWDNWADANHEFGPYSPTTLKLWNFYNDAVRAEVRAGC
jgi:hypothetical protein